MIIKDTINLEIIIRFITGRKLFPKNLERMGPNQRKLLTVCKH